MTFLIIPFLFSSAMAEVRMPLYLLYQAKGQVKLTRDGKNWRPISSSKFLFDRYQVQTGKNSSCKLLNQSNASIQILSEKTHIIINDTSIQTIAGNILSEGEATGILGNIQQNFVKALRYTVVRRSVSHSQSDSFELKTVRKIKLCKLYPDLVWQHIHPGCQYRLIVDQQQFNVSEQTHKKLVRFKLPELSNGTHEYIVQVLKNGKVVYQPDKKQKLYWLSEKEQNAILNGKKFIENIDPENGFLIGNYMEEQGLMVPAMDHYRTFFEQNPDENEMRPFLIKLYSDLKLKCLKHDEINKYNAVQ
jgi:hypothetical protein